MTCLRNDLVTTRKEHRCHGCSRRFPKGTEMWYWVGIYEGDFNAGYMCETCQKLMNYTDSGDDGYPEGFVNDHLERGETPEILLRRLKRETELRCLNLEKTRLNL